MTVAIVLGVAILAAAVFYIVKYLSGKKNSKPSVQKPVFKPVEPPKHEEPEPEPEQTPEQIPEPEPQPEPKYNETFERYLNAFSDYVHVERGSKTYEYMECVFMEAYMQYYGSQSSRSLPLLLVKDNFQSPIEGIEDGGRDKSFDALIGWLFALQLAELRPTDRTGIFKVGYELGGYDKNSNVYGWRWDTDHNNMRLVAAAIYAGMRGIVNPDIEQMRKEVGGSKYKYSLATLADGKRDMVGNDDFFIDLRDFMPTAPGPYAIGYASRPEVSYPNEEKDEYGNLKIDRSVHEEIVKMYNLSDSDHRQDTVQAIADKEGDPHHLFGIIRTTKHYHFNPVFGKEYIGMTIDPEGAVAQLAVAAQAASNSARGILQSASVSPVQYGRLRPGCDWRNEAMKNSATDDRRNVLVDFEIEDGDGCPTGYYDEKGNWVILNGVHSPEEFEEKSKHQLYANSYPSGHSSGIWGAAMALIELMPDKADKIMYAANRFSMSRSIARYHWLSDIINGRVLGTAQNAVSHAAVDYDEMIEKARRELYG